LEILIYSSQVELHHNRYVLIRRILPFLARFVECQNSHQKQQPLSSVVPIINIWKKNEKTLNEKC
jgi:hypothetical protein